MQYFSLFNLVEVSVPPPIRCHTVESVCDIFGAETCLSIV